MITTFGSLIPRTAHILSSSNAAALRMDGSMQRPGNKQTRDELTADDKIAAVAN
jgi:hypothetical protein